MIYEDFATYRRSRPASLPAATIAEAEKYLSEIRGVMFPAPRQTVTKWLAALVLCSAGNMPTEDIKLKLKLYADLLTEPEFCYSKETLKAAASQFRWFPAFSELQEFLSGQGEDIRRLNHRLTEIVSLPTDEEIAATKAKEEAEKLAKMLATPEGRIRHRHWDRFYRTGGRLAFSGSWYEMVASLVALHGEDLTDRWHTEIAAMDWDALGFNPFAELRSRSRARLNEFDPDGSAEAKVLASE